MLKKTLICLLALIFLGINLSCSSGGQEEFVPDPGPKPDPIPLLLDPVPDTEMEPTPDPDPVTVPDPVSEPTTEDNTDPRPEIKFDPSTGRKEVKEGRTERIRVRLENYEGNIEWNTTVDEGVVNVTPLNRDNKWEITGLVVGEHTITFTASEEGNPEQVLDQKDFIAEVTPNPIEITSGIRDSMEVGENFAVSLRASGGSRERTWSVRISRDDSLDEWEQANEDSLPLHRRRLFRDGLVREWVSDEQVSFRANRIGDYTIELIVTDTLLRKSARKEFHLRVTEEISLPAHDINEVVQCGGEPLQVELVEVVASESEIDTEKLLTGEGADVKSGETFYAKFRVTGGQSPYRWEDTPVSTAGLPIDMPRSDMSITNPDFQRNGFNLGWEGEISSTNANNPNETPLNDIYIIRGKFRYRNPPSVQRFKELVYFTAWDSCQTGRPNIQLPSMLFNVDRGKPIQLIQVKTQTGRQAGAETNGDIYIQFCSDKNFTDCSFEMQLDHDGYNDRRHNQLDTYALPALKESNLEVMRERDIATFRVMHKGSGGAWQLQGIEVDILTENSDTFRPIYIGSCVNRWLTSGETAPFSLNDTIVCTVIETADVRKAGTDDDIYMYFPLKGYTDIYNLYPPTEGPYFEFAHFDTTDQRFDQVRFVLDWGDPDHEFEQGSIFTYGSHFFDSSPIKTEFWLTKERDGGSGGWKPGSIEVYINQPGDPRFLDENQCWYVKYEPNCWIQNETEGSCGSDSLSYGSAADPMDIGVKTDDPICNRLRTIDNGEFAVGGAIWLPSPY